MLNKKAISEIEKATQNQSENKVWFEQLYGRITASNLHNVVSRLKFEKEEPIKNLVKSILHPKPFQSFATRHGIATEPHAKKEITRLLKLQQNYKPRCWYCNFRNTSICFCITRS